MEHTIELLLTQSITHDVRRFITSRPEGFAFESGQGVELAIDLPGWRDKGRPFTPTSLPSDQVLEFIIKGYPDHGGVTRQLHTLNTGARLRMSEPFGTIAYAGPGVFLAGGAGLTPFLSILRRLQAEDGLSGCSLLFSNKTPDDMICEQELRALLGDRATLICSKVEAPGYVHARIDKTYLQQQVKDFSQHFYVCGPKQMVKDVRAALQELGAETSAVVFEQ